MIEQLTAGQFHSAEGVGDWRVLFSGACTYFRTGSFAAGVALVDEIGELADAASHHPDIDLRYDGVTVRLITHSVGGLTNRDVALARQISAAARARGLTAEPAAVQHVNITVDVVDRPAVRAFWRAVLAYSDAGEEDLADPHASGPSFWFQDVAQRRAGRNGMHVDVSVPHDEAEARIAAAVRAGGRLISDKFAPAWWTLADPEGNEADVATWMGRDS